MTQSEARKIVLGTVCVGCGGYKEVAHWFCPACLAKVDEVTKSELVVTGSVDNDFPPLFEKALNEIKEAK